jgi:hypothetical protein
VASGGAAIAGALDTDVTPRESGVTGSTSGAGLLLDGAGGGREDRAACAPSAFAGGGFERRDGAGGGTEGREPAAVSLPGLRAELGADAAALDEGTGDSERRRRLLSQTGVKNPDRRSNSPTWKLFDGLLDSVSRSSVVMVVLASCSTSSCMRSREPRPAAAGHQRRQLPEAGAKSSRQVVRLEPLVPASIQPCAQTLYSVSSCPSAVQTNSSSAEHTDDVGSQMSHCP